MRWARDVPCVQRPFVLAKIHIYLIQTKLECNRGSTKTVLFLIKTARISDRCLSVIRDIVKIKCNYGRFRMRLRSRVLQSKYKLQSIY